MTATLATSAVFRALRSILQLAFSIVTVEAVEAIGQRLGAQWHFDQALTLLLVTVLTALYSYLHRRFLDPSRVPSLQDPTSITNEETP